jgi:peroxiredoxin Q/BCP
MKNLSFSFLLPLALGMGLLAAVRSPAQPAPMPKVGDKAPLVTGKDQDGKTWKLEKRIGKKIVLLYFYPKDDTPGCTKEACGFRDRMETFKQQGVEVVGVSFDSPESHQQFIAKHRLSFTLLSDTDGKIAEAYGVRVPGRNFARRVSFLIGLDGKIAHITDSPQAETHVNEMTEAVARLKGTKPTGRAASPRLGHKPSRATSRHARAARRARLGFKTFDPFPTVQLSAKTF